MRKLILKLRNRLKLSVDWSIKKMEKVRDRLSQKEPEQLHYASLSPINNANENDEYDRAIRWALENRNQEGIKNIALTGPNGSGKSSILKTFQEKYNGNKFTFLNISLATFQEEKIDKNKEADKRSEDAIKDKNLELLRLIETSILQQIFYQESDRKIPDSNFKKIKHLGRGRRFFLTGFAFIYSISIIHLSNDEVILNLLKINEPLEYYRDVMHFVGLSVFVLCTLFILYKSIRLISSIAINKLKIRDMEIGLKMSIHKSVLNQHIDEIIYFFRVRPYNVVIIEDLDRFKETEIFTKLRELNLLLNNSQKHKKSDIVFIYAVRDDMFTDAERTKFFDFIIPVIPIVNSINSKDIFLKKNEKLDKKLSESFLTEVAYFIDDMRLIHNIMNEFTIYRSKLNNQLDANKLFAIILYKNCYPKDFVQLNKNKGKLYGHFQKKSEIIRGKIEETDHKVNKLKTALNSLRLVLSKDIRELRMVYILKAIELCTKNFVSFQKDEAALRISDLLEDEHFKAFQLDKINYSYRFGHMGGVKQTRLEKFDRIEALVDEGKSYVERALEIDKIRNNGFKELQTELLVLEDQKREVRNKSLEELMKNDPDLINDAEDLTYLLLKKGFIAEDYPNYITLFYGQSLSQSDFEFILAVKKGEYLEPEYELINAGKVIANLSQSDFETHVVLNFSLVSAVLRDSSNYLNEKEKILKTLNDSSKQSFDFVKAYLFSEHASAEFYEGIKGMLGQVLSSLRKDDFYTEEESLKTIILDFLFYSDMKSIKAVSEQFDLKEYLLEESDFLTTLSDTGKTMEIIKTLDLQFAEALDFKLSPFVLLEFIYQNNYYVLSPLMMKNIMQTFGNFDEKNFSAQNFKAVTESDAEHLVNRVKRDIESYIDDVYLEIETNNREDEIHYLQLLNADGLPIDKKQKLIQHVHTKVSLSSDIGQFRVVEGLIRNNKLHAGWKNLVYAFLKYLERHNEESVDVLPDFIAGFLNNKPNAKALSKDTFPKEMKRVRLFGNLYYIHLMLKIRFLTYLLKIPPGITISLTLKKLIWSEPLFLSKMDVFDQNRLYSMVSKDITISFI